MFCPQCGAEITSDRVRFCTHCRFPVGSVKGFIVTEVTKSQSEDEKKHYPLRQRDITLGAGLMFLGAIKALVLTMASTHRLSGEGFGIYLFLLSLLFSAFLLFSQLSPRQRGLTIGATLIFLGSALSVPIGILTDPPGVLLIPALLTPIILFLVKIVRAFMRIFFDKEVLPEKKVSPHPQPALNPTYPSASALPSAQNAPVVEPSTNRMKEAEIVRPFSVTENTTEMLKNKRLLNQS